MIFKKNIRNSRDLIIPDVHQNFCFIESIIENESLAEFKSIIFLGDFYDSKLHRFSSTDSLKRTLELVLSLISSFPDKVEILIGNHDLLYYSLCNPYVNSREKNALIEYYQLPNQKTLTASRSLNIEEIISRSKIATIAGNYVVSHAGIDKHFWQSGLDEKENVKNLNQELICLTDENFCLKEVFQAGKARGGVLPKGGPLWLDWNIEFDEHDSIMQVVGHTADSKYRRSGKSYCIDATQRQYAIISGEKITIKEAKY